MKEWEFIPASMKITIIVTVNGVPARRRTQNARAC
jgi:hypothetical protein